MWRNRNSYVAGRNLKCYKHLGEHLQGMKVQPVCLKDTALLQSKTVCARKAKGRETWGQNTEPKRAPRITWKCNKREQWQVKSGKKRWTVLYRVGAQLLLPKKNAVGPLTSPPHTQITSSGQTTCSDSFTTVPGCLSLSTGTLFMERKFHPSLDPLH